MTESIAERIEIRSWADPHFDQNCLVIQRRDTRACLLVDPGLQFQEVAAVIEKEDLQVDHILLTHGHVDHVFGVPAIRELTGAPTHMHPLDQPQLARNPTTIRQFGLDPGLFGTPQIDHDLVEGRPVGWEDLAFQVIHTPGHTPGSVCFLLGDRCLGGDTLFRRGVGRTDLFGGDSEALIASIQGKLFRLPADTVVYPGHGPVTTIGEEIRENPFVSLRRT
jgi:hydroxyacylglutathione hydrolase